MAHAINVLSELERYGLDYKFKGTDEVAVCCPFHEDSSPSCDISVSKGLFKCRASSCGQDGDIIALLARHAKSTRKLVLEDLSTRYTLVNEPSINPKLIETYHNHIWKADVLLEALKHRCVDEALIRKYRLGEFNGRITIPITNEVGDFVNIRSYLPGAPGAEKMKNLKGRAKKLRFYPQDQLAYNKIVICGGEMKALASSKVLNQHGYGCICVTAGEGTWAHYLTPIITGKNVWVMMDIDEAGLKAVETICRFINKHTVETRIVELPLDPVNFPKGDVNDFLRIGGDLLQCINNAREWSAVSAVDDNVEARELSLSEASNAKWAGKRIKLLGTVTALDASPYVIPKKCKVMCTRDQNECAVCPVFAEKEDHEYEIHPESEAILEMVNSRKNSLQYALMNEFGIPSTCRVCKMEPTEHYNVEDARVSSQLEILNDSSNEKTMQPAMCIGSGLELNESYVFEGKMHPHPATQQATLMISAYKATQDALASFKLEDADHLKFFQPEEWSLEALKKRLDSLYADLELNVTRIFQRRDIHIFADLAYHSPLFVNLDGDVVKGWVEVLIIGDSAQGKSETVMSLQKHYGLGEKIECKNATVAGLLGGLQQTGNRWFVTWGLFPTHDRRLVILEELKGAPVEVISKLTDMRSSGIAELPKIEKRKTRARTRVIALSNCRSAISLDRYSFGVSAIKELIGNPEDVRRFDACLVVERGEVNVEDINKSSTIRKQSVTVHTSKLCRELILWAWTVKHTVFEPDAIQTLLDEAVAMCNEFSDAIPIVDRGSMRYKLARLSASLACRTFSVDENNNCLIRKCHVQYIVELLLKVYRKKSCGYLDYSRAQKLATELVEPEAILNQLNNTPDPSDMRTRLLYTEFIEYQDVVDWTAWDRTAVTVFISFLVRKQALVRRGRNYVKSAAFINFLRESEDKITKRPKHIPEEF